MLLQLRNKQLHVVSLNKEEVKTVTLLKGKKSLHQQLKSQNLSLLCLPGPLREAQKKPKKPKTQPHSTS